MEKQMRNTLGFTLAEVLITLGIIGVVAALTMPVLVRKFKIIELHTKFNKEYAVIQQAMKQTLADLELSRPSDMRVYYNNDTNKVKESFDEINKIWESKFKGATKVKASTYNFKPVFYYFFGEQSGIYGTTYNNYYLLPDGSLISDLGYHMSYGNLVVPYVFFDTNGFNKGPNRIGYDQFFYHNEGEIEPLFGNADFKLDCDPFLKNRVNGYWDRMQLSACSGYALRNINPYDVSKKYWDSLYKPKSWWEKLKK